MCVQSGQQARSHRRTQRRRAEGVSKPHAFTGDTINLRSQYKGMARAPNVVPPQIINKHNNNVRADACVRRRYLNRDDLHQQSHHHETRKPPAAALTVNDGPASSPVLRLHRTTFLRLKHC